VTAGRNDLPKLYGSETPRTHTAVYFENGSAFGAPHARPAPPAADHFDDEPAPAPVSAAGSGPVAGSQLADQFARTLDIAVALGVVATLRAELLAARRALLAERAEHAAAEFSRDMEAELRAVAEAGRDQLRAELAQVRADLAATTIDAVRIALDRAARAITGRSATELDLDLDLDVATTCHPGSPDELFDDSDADLDTVVVDPEQLLGGAP